MSAASTRVLALGLREPQDTEPAALLVRPDQTLLGVIYVSGPMPSFEI